MLDDRSLNGVFLNGELADWGRSPTATTDDRPLSPLRSGTLNCVNIPASGARSMRLLWSQLSNPRGPPLRPEPPEVAAERARERLHEEIERVRSGVEEMLAEQESGKIDERR